MEQKSWYYTVKLYRIVQTDHATLGLLSVERHRVEVPTIRRETLFTCYALENPWLNNKVNVSCIPTGTYTLKLARSPRFGESWHVQNVCGRTHILFHAGNYAHDTHGCILPGMDVMSTAKLAVASSRTALRKFMAALDVDVPPIETILKVDVCNAIRGHNRIVDNKTPAGLR